MNVNYTESGTDPTIHKFYRDEDGERIHETEEDFEPYFFVRVEEEVDVETYPEIVRVEKHDGWFNLDDEPLKKVVCRTPDDVGGYGGIRNEFERSWESDVYFRSRYWLDEMEPEDQSDYYRTLSFDIETKRSLDQQNAPKEIIAITAHDNFEDKYITFFLNPEHNEINNQKDEDWSIYSYDEERQMLLDFLEFVKSLDPDIITAWNLPYDATYLVNRMRNLRIDYSELSPINRVSLTDDYSEVRSVKGRDMIDMIDAFKKVFFGDLESYRLNNVGANLLGKEKVKFDVGIAQLWEDNPMKLIEYNKRDVEIMIDLDDRYRIWDLVKEIQSEVGINLEDCIHPTRTSQAYFMRRSDYIMPSKADNEYKGGGQKYSGGYVKEATPGISENVAVLDLASQYPSSMISYNMSPEKKVPDPDATDKETVTVGNGVTFEYDEMGFVPKILLGLMDRRDEEKEKRDQYDPDDLKYKQHDLTQYALKVIANSIYGVIGSTQFMLYDKDIASSTTYVGRETIQWSLERAKEMGYEPIYSDTDSIMVSMGEDIDDEKAVEKAEKLGSFINETYDDYAEQNGVDLTKFGRDIPHKFEIEAEKFYARFFMQDAKKKYAGHIKWKEGKWVDKFDFAQYGKKSDMAQLSRDLQTEFLKKVLRGASKKELQEYVTDICSKIKDGEYSDDYIGIPGKMKKSFEEYETDRPVIRASKFTNKHLSEQFGKGSKPKYVYVKRTPPGMPDTDAVAFSEMALPEELLIDRDKMMRKLVRDKLKRILSALDYDWREMHRTSGNLLDP